MWTWAAKRKMRRKKRFFKTCSGEHACVRAHTTETKCKHKVIFENINLIHFNLEENVVIKRKKMATVPWKPLVTLQICAKFLLLLSAFKLTFGDYCIYHRFNVWLETSKRAVINFIFYMCKVCQLQMRPDWQRVSK